MRFARYEHQGAVSNGVLGPGDRLHGLAAGQDTDTLIRLGGLDALRDAGAGALARAAGPAAPDVRLLAPLRPASTRRRPRGRRLPLSRSAPAATTTRPGSSAARCA